MFKDKSKFFSNQRGVSLVQVLMASTAIAGLALIGLRLAKDQKELAVKTYQTYLLEYFTQEVTQLLLEPGICRETMAGLSPENDTFPVIKESKDSNGENILLHFPSSVYEGSDGALFHKEFTLNSYLINGSHPEANLEKNITVIELNLTQVNQTTPIKKAIPISFQDDDEGKILECSAKVLVGEGPAEGFWKRQGTGLNLPNLSAIVGDMTDRNAGIAVVGRMKLEVSTPLPACSSKSEGVMVYNDEGKLVYCFNEKWQPVGFNVFSWQGNQKYSLAQNKYGNVEKKLGPHRYCYFVRQSFNGSSDSCTLLRKFEGQASSVYLLSAKTTDNVTNINCEVTCVD